MSNAYYAAKIARNKLTTIKKVNYSVVVEKQKVLLSIQCVNFKSTIESSEDTDYFVILLHSAISKSFTNEDKMSRLV